METVPFYDVETKKLVRIPRAELRPGVILSRVDGIDEDVFVLASQLKRSPVRNHNFGPDLMGEIRHIHEVLQEVHPLTLEEWVDGFQRDRDPRPEISLFLHAADVFETFANPELTSKEEREDIFRVIVACMTATYETVWSVLALSVLDRNTAQQVVDRYFER